MRFFGSAASSWWPLQREVADQRHADRHDHVEASVIFGMAAAARVVDGHAPSSGAGARVRRTVLAVLTTSPSVLVIDTTTGAPPPTLIPPNFHPREPSGLRPPGELPIIIDISLGRKRN